VSFGDSAHPTHNPLNDQIDLETADGLGYPSSYEEVTADLLTVPKLDPGHRPAAGPRETALAGDTGEVIPLILWCEALLVAAFATVLMARRWSRSAMDEPCSALDPTSTRRIEETIGDLEGQVTIVIVTHNMQQAARVSSHCAFFLAGEDSPGRVVESGPTEQIFSGPKDERTSDYIHGRFG
jgi:hypothetical protein